MRLASYASLNLAATVALSSSVLIGSLGSPANAARRCPLGEILRVTKNTCESKAANLDLLGRRRTKPKPVAEARPERIQTTIVDKTAPVEGRTTAAAREQSGPQRSAPAPASSQVAERDTPPEENLFVPKFQAKRVEPSPYGELFVGAFKGSLAGDAAVPR